MIEEEGLVENARRMGDILQSELRRIAPGYPTHIGVVHGKGLVAALHMIQPGGIEPNKPLGPGDRPPGDGEGAADVRPGWLCGGLGQDLAAALHYRRTAA